MIKQINISNFAIIEDLQLEFENGFNVLTGETGAGKSIIIDALSLLTGERANASMVRFGCNKAYVEGIFVLHEELKQELQELYGIEIEEYLIVKREIDDLGKSVSRMNHRITTNTMIKEIMSRVVDIHSQHDNQYLLEAKNHLKLIDLFGKKDLVSLKQDYQKSYKTYLQLKKELAQAKQEIYSEEQMELMKFQWNEINNFELKENEIEEMEQESKRLASFEKNSSRIKETLNYFSGETGIIDLLYLAKKSLSYVSEDSLFDSDISGLEELYYKVSEAADLIKEHFESIDYDEERMHYVSDRLFAMNKLRRKYGKDYQSIMEVKKTLEEKIARMEDQSGFVSHLEEKMKEAYEESYQISTKLSQKRKQLGEILSKMIVLELNDLYLLNANFEFAMNRLVDLSIEGIDSGEFFVSINKGQPLKPLAKVASGGEISRLMLGLKVIFNKLSKIECVIFDEVDTGVSGKVAFAVGEKIKNLSLYSQVLCITHLPQVASLADYHYHVSKAILGEKTITKVKILNKEERIEEIAKMLSGENISSISLENAKEFLKLGKN